MTEKQDEIKEEIERLERGGYVSPHDNRYIKIQELKKMLKKQEKK